MKYDFTKFRNSMDSIGIELTDAQLNAFETYYDMLIDRNKVMNLTAITEFDEVMDKHFLDSVYLFRSIKLRYRCWFSWNSVKNCFSGVKNNFIGFIE